MKDNKKLIIIGIIIILFVGGFGAFKLINKKIAENKEKNTLTCLFNEKMGLFKCDNIYEEGYNSRGDLTYLKTDDGKEYRYEYEYQNNLVTKITINKKSIAIIYDNQDRIEKKIYDDGIEYHFTYGNENIESIKKIKDEEVLSETTFIFEDDGKVKEKTTYPNDYIVTRLYKEEDAFNLPNSFNLINYLPEIYLKNNEYLFSNVFTNINSDQSISEYIPIFTSSIQSILIENTGKLDVTLYNFNVTNKLLYDSNYENIYNSKNIDSGWQQNRIYQKDDKYFKQDTDYNYDENGDYTIKIYPEEKISQKKYEELKELYLPE